jgi:hypothetical protein
LKDKYEQDMRSMKDEMNQQFKHIMSMIQQNYSHEETLVHLFLHHASKLLSNGHDINYNTVILFAELVL